MAEAVHRPALHEIEIPLAVVVPQPGAFAFDENGRRPSGDVHECVRGIGVEVHDGLMRGFKSGWRRAARASEACEVAVDALIRRVVVAGAARGGPYGASATSCGRRSGEPWWVCLVRWRAA